MLVTPARTRSCACSSCCVASGPGAARDLHAGVRGLQIEQRRRHVGANACAQIVELRLSRLEIRVGLRDLAARRAAIEDRHAHVGRDGEGPLDGRDARAEAAIVGVEMQRRQRVAARRLQRGAGRVDAGLRRAQILTGRVRRGERGLERDRRRGRVGRVIAELELLVERQADRAGELQLLLLERVLGRDEARPRRFELDLLTQHVDAGDDAGRALVFGETRQRLGGRDLRLRGGDAGFVGDGLEVHAADGQHDELADVAIGVRLGDRERLALVIRAERRRVVQRRVQEHARVEHAERANHLRHALESREAERGEIDDLRRLSHAAKHVGEQGGEIALALSLAVAGPRLLEDDREVVIEPAADRVGERQLDRRGGRRARRHAVQEHVGDRGLLRLGAG